MNSTLSKGKPPTPFIPESIKLVAAYRKAINGVGTSLALETLAGIPVTAHILGGAVIGKDRTTGVIDKDNKVFGYQHMFVINGAKKILYRYKLNRFLIDLDAACIKKKIRWLFAHNNAF